MTTLHDTKYPCLNKLYAAFIIVSGVLTGCFLLYVAVFNAEDIITTIICSCIALIAGVGSIISVYRASKIKITDLGICSKKVRISWVEVTQIKRIGYGIHVLSSDNEIIVAPWAYQNPEELIQFISKVAKVT